MKTIWLDDATLDQYEIVFPILKRLNLKDHVIISVPTGRIGKLLSRTELDVPMMNFSQLKEMVAFGCEIASHSVTHTPLLYLTTEQLEWELQTSKEWIMDNFGVVPTTFVAPKNDYTPEQEVIIKKYYSHFRTLSECYTGIIIHVVRDDPEHILSQYWKETDSWILYLTKKLEDESRDRLRGK
jgi:peptidoglycan/xylan/chitin deacetylase (PgdA/CDA1 family)